MRLGAGLGRRELPRDGNEIDFKNFSTLLAFNLRYVPIAILSRPVITRRPCYPRLSVSRPTLFATQRITAWQELVGCSIVDVDIEPLEAGGLRAEATASLLPGLGLIFAYSDAHRCIHPRPHIKTMIFVHGGVGVPMTASQLGRHPTLGRRRRFDDNANIGSMTSAASRFAAFAVPRAAIAALVPDVGATIARPISANNPAFRLLLGYLATANDVQGLITSSPAACRCT